MAARWPASRVTLTWSAKRRQYLVTTDGKPDVGADRVQHGASTVVVQYVTTRMSANRDVNGRPTPVVQATGTGRATVLRGGKAWQGTWSRKTATSPTAITAQGKAGHDDPGRPCVGPARGAGPERRRPLTQTAAVRRTGGHAAYPPVA